MKWSILHPFLLILLLPGPTQLIKVEVIEKKRESKADRWDSARAWRQGRTDQERFIASAVPSGWNRPSLQYKNEGIYGGKNYTEVWRWAGDCMSQFRNPGSANATGGDAPPLESYLNQYLKIWKFTDRLRGGEEARRMWKRHQLAIDVHRGMFLCHISSPPQRKFSKAKLSEGKWIEEFSDMPARHFYPLMPLFVEWSTFHTALGFEKLKKFVIPRYRYLTVMESGCGAAKYLGGDDWSNVIFLSPGGAAHIALPHVFKVNLTLFPWQRRTNFPERLTTISFRGKATYAKEVKSQLRMDMIKDLNLASDALQQGGVRVILAPDLPPNTTQYISEVNASGLVLAPRGFAASSYRMYEAMTSGAVPVYIYNDLPWLPYPCDLDWSKLAVILHYTEFPEWLEGLPAFVKSQAYKDMFTSQREATPKYFTPSSVMSQIEGLIHRPRLSPLGVCYPKLPVPPGQSRQLVSRRAPRPVLRCGFRSLDRVGRVYYPTCPADQKRESRS